ncbi:acyltransferase [Salinibacterium sp. SYSU T00001]|uniref:acyltransferase family protein n=1 Tax=Homoserinimonas sedimenticola TaxID=2986805 RepID=UPI0022355CEF|nr:acyltransferase family protein [Salinibacterium sedimenticola]MCW4385039.1 acyltransferase [Salinibacterium sedimenticola]
MTSADLALADARAKATPQRRDIQGLRAIAVAAVVVNHAVPDALPGGYVGVDVFFVISGFLITSLIVRELAGGEGFDFSRFYVRRIRRILPASLVVAVVTFVVCLIWLPPTLIPGVGTDLVATVFYVPNIAFAIEGTDYLAGTEPSPFQHYWSLGIEEQFYLLWPLLLVVAWRAWAQRSSGLLAVTVAVCAASFAWCQYVTYTSPVWAFFSLPTRAWELALGGVAALLAPRVHTLCSPAVAAVLSWLGLAAIVTSAVVLPGAAPFPGWLAAIPAAGAVALILGGGREVLWGPEIVLGRRPLQFVGEISYSLYLVHWPLLIVPITVIGASSEVPAWIGVVLGLAALPIAWLLYRWVEQPFRHAPGVVNLRPRVVIGGAGVASLLAAILAATSLPVADARLAANGEVADVASHELGLVVPPEFSTIVPSNLTPALTEASTDIPSIYRDGCHLDWTATEPIGCSFGDVTSGVRVALFGDSHAAQWFPAVSELAERHGFQVDSYTKSSCPSAVVDVVLDALPYDECSTWRSAVLERLVADPVDLVIVSNASNGAEAELDEWLEGLQQTVERVSAVSPVVVIADTPYLPLVPPTCLAANMDDTAACTVSPERAIRGKWAGALAATATAAGAKVIDLNDHLCDDDECGPIIGARLVYRDAHHLTASFARDLASVLWDEISVVAPLREGH